MIKDNQVLAGGFEVKVNQKPLDEKLQAYLREVKVEQTISRPGAFLLRFEMGDFTELTKEKLEIMNTGLKNGDEIAIGMGFGTDTGDFKTLLVGDIVVVEPQLQESISLEVRGYDRLWKLQSLPQKSSENGSFKDMKDSAIVSQIAQAVGLSAEAEDTKTVHAQLMRNNRNYFSFLEERAKLLGFEFMAQGKKIIFRKSKQGGSADITMRYGIDLSAFSVQCRPAPGGVEVRSWDSKKKKEIVATATNDSTGVTRSPIMVNDETVEDAEHASQIAKAKLEAMMRQFFSAEGRCTGNPALVVGTNVKVEGIGEVFGGVYYVTETVHSLDAEGFMTSFKAQRTGP